MPFAKSMMIAMLCLGVISPVFAEDNTRVSKQIEALSSKKKANERKIKQKERAKHKAASELGKVKKNLRYTELRLNRAKRRLRVTAKKVNQTEVRIRAQEKTYELKKIRFVGRIRAIYKNGYLGWLALLLSPQELKGLEDTSYYFERLVKEDIRMIKEIKVERQKLDLEKDRLLRQQKEQRAIRSQITREEKKLAQKKRQKSRYISSLDKQIAKIEAQNQAIEKSSKRLTSFLRSQSGKSVYYGSGKFIKPVRGWLSSKFGMRKHPISKRWRKHNGIDFAAPRGYRIKASDAGVVIAAGYKSMFRGYGKVTVIDHGRVAATGKRLSSIYAHQSRILVKEGDFVKQGDEIGWVGSTGYSTGPHLHFEIRENGVPVNPMKYMKL